MANPATITDVPKTFCVMMQKDERFLLAPWIAYHGYLFGFQNLCVLDNGSESPDVLNTLAQAEAKGVRVVWHWRSRADYLAKGEIVGTLLQALDTRKIYDFLMPLDCDEFVVLRTPGSFDCSREAVLDYLTTLMGAGRPFRFPYQLANHPLYPDLYHNFEFFKVFFAAGAASPIDHGSHQASGWPAEEIPDSHLIHLHFHHKIFDVKRAEARRGWVGTADPDRPEDLAGYTGPSAHLNRFFLESREDYYRGFEDTVHFFLPRFRALLAKLGAPLDLPAEDPPDSFRPEVIGSDDDGVLALIPKSRSVRFHETHYLAANPDLVAAAVDPTLHFCEHGFREQRPLRPKPKTGRDHG